MDSNGVLFSMSQCASQGSGSEEGSNTGLREKGNSFDEVLRIIRLLHSISIRPLLHTFGVIVVSAVSATPCGLERKSAQLSDSMQKVYQSI
jgi:hypothetical protein